MSKEAHFQLGTSAFFLPILHKITVKTLTYQMHIMHPSEKSARSRRKYQGYCYLLHISHLKSLVLQDFLNGNKLSWITEFGLIHNTKRSISYHLCICVTDFLRSVWTLSRSCYHCGHFAAIFVSWNIKNKSEIVNMGKPTLEQTNIQGIINLSHRTVYYRKCIHSYRVPNPLEISFFSWKGRKKTVLPVFIWNISRLLLCST